MPIYFTREKLTETRVDAILRPGEQTPGAKPGEIHINNTDAGLPRFIIHATLNGTETQSELQQAYASSLQLAQESGCQSIAFPLLPSGTTAARQAAETFLEDHEMDVYLSLPQDQQPLLINRDLSEKIKIYLDDNFEAATFRAKKSLKADLDFELMEMASEPVVLPMAAAPKRSLEDVVNNLDETFSEMLLRLIDEKGLSDVETYKKANLDRKLFSKIRSNKDYRPSKPTVLALAVSLRLNLDETTDLLQKAGLALSHSHKFDVIIEYFILNGIYDIFEINEALFSFDQVLLGG